MFGRQEWFRPKRIGWGLVPVTWQGWLYSAGWIGGIMLPFLLLTGRHQPTEASIWLAVACGFLAYDVRQILRGYNSSTSTRAPAATGDQRNDNVLYILDSQPGQTVATRNFNLQVR
jgi:hypothetical protein